MNPSDMPKRPTMGDIDAAEVEVRLWEAIKVWPEITAKPIEGSKHHVYYLGDIHMEELCEDLSKVFKDIAHKTTSNGFNIGSVLSDLGWPVDAWLVETIDACMQHSRREMLEDAVEWWVEENHPIDDWIDIEGATVTYDRMFVGEGLKEVSGVVVGGDPMTYTVFTREDGEPDTINHFLPIEKIKSTSPPGRFH